MRIIIKVLDKYLSRDNNGDPGKLPTQGYLLSIHTYKRITKTRLILTNERDRTLVFTLVREGIPVDSIDGGEMNIMFIPKSAEKPPCINTHVWEYMEPCYLCKNITNHFYLSTTEVTERVIVIQSETIDPFMTITTTTAPSNIFTGESTMEGERLNLWESTDIVL